MSHFEFTIPLQKDKLLESHAGQYHVEDIVQPRLLLSKLQDAARAYNDEGVEYLLEHFDTYFSIIVHGNQLEWNIINKGFNHIMRTAKNLCNHLELLLQENLIDNDIRTKNLNITKMTMYLFTQLMKTKDAKSTVDNSKKLTLGKKGKKKSDAEEICEWTEADKQAALVTLHSVVLQPLSKLWDPPLAEDNFISMVADPCYKALEEQIIKNKVVREIVFQVFGILIKKYNHATSCLIKLVQILQMIEHAVSPICAGVVQLTKDFGLNTFAPQMVREIAEALSSSDEENAIGTEQGAAKNCGQFLLELTKELPKEMTHAISTLQCYLESNESYTLRISVLGMMCEIVNVELTGEELTDEQRSQRDDFLDDLYEHMHDVSAYVRHKVLQYWSRLQRENCVPVSRQRVVLERCIGRLRDKAALVRKAAIQLLKIFLECNPFSGQLKLDILEEQLREEQAALDELQRKVNQCNPEPDPKLVEKWNKIEADIISMIKKNLDIPTQYEPELSQASLENIYDSIRKHLREKNYYKAYLIVKHTERQYPEAKLLRCDMEKSDQIDYFVALLRNVFVTPAKRQSFTQECENELALYKRVEEKESIVAFLQESVHFSRSISEAMPVINTLLLSKQSGDFNEAIDFFTTAHHFNIDAAKLGVANMLQLVWSPEQEKREAVERAYRSMYLQSDAKVERARAFAVASKLVALVAHIDYGSALALEHLVAKWVDKGDVTPAVIQVFWEMFLKKIDGTTDWDSYAALSILVMVAKAQPSLAVANMEVIQTYGFKADYRCRNLSVQLLKALAQKKVRYPAEHSLFTSLYESVMEMYNECDRFTSFAGNAIDLIYAICDTPEVICIKLLSDIYKGVARTMSAQGEAEEGPVSTELLIRFIFVLGQIALQQLIYLDTSVYSELRRRNQVREDRKLEEKRKKKAGNFATPGRKGRVKDLRVQALMNISNASASSRNQRSASVTSNAGTSANTSTAEEEGDLEGAVAEDADAEYVRGVCERDIVGPGAALACYVPLLRHLLSDPGNYAPPLQAAAALTYTRFMFVSSAVCEEGLQLIVTVLKRSEDVSLRTNLTIAFADLTLRFPNLTQPWTHHIFEILNDKELEVRQCAVKMLSFLILHEMVRVKGQIANMALCCADQDARIASMTKLFFKNLSQKGNALYNVMPDIISRLSEPELKVPEQQFRDIMKYITSLIQKDKQMEALVEKLCQRFKLATEERQWRDLAYCLSLLKYNERSLKKLIENIDCYKDKVHCKGVMECFNTIMNNTSKMARTELKMLVTELGDKIEECFAVRRADGEGGTDEDVEEVQSGRSKDAVRATPRRKAAPRRNRRRSSSSPDENEPISNVMTPGSVRKSSRKVTARYNKVVSDDSDDEEQSDQEVFKKPATRKPARKRK